MFGKKKKIEESEEMELLEKSPLDEWEEDEVAAGAEVKRKLFGNWKKKERKEKSVKEKTPLTPAQKKKRRKRIIIGALAAFVLVFMVLPRLFAPDVLPVVTVSEASLGTVQQVVEGSVEDVLLLVRSSLHKYTAQIIVPCLTCSELDVIERFALLLRLQI